MVAAVTAALSGADGGLLEARDAGGLSQPTDDGECTGSVLEVDTVDTSESNFSTSVLSPSFAIFAVG